MNLGLTPELACLPSLFYFPVNGKEIVLYMREWGLSSSAKMSWSSIDGLFSLVVKYVYPPPISLFSLLNIFKCQVDKNPSSKALE